MKPKSLVEFFTNIEKELPYVSHNLSPVPFEQPSLTVTVLLEYFFEPSDTIDFCNRFFPIDIFGKNIPISFSIIDINRGNQKVNRKLTIHIERLFSISTKEEVQIAEIFDEFFKEIELTKRIKNSFMYVKIAQTKKRQ